MLSKVLNRRDAGRQLAVKLASSANDARVVVLGLPRGGVPVAFEVAQALGVPLDVFLVRKLGVPGHEELAMGALASGVAIFACGTGEERAGCTATSVTSLSLAPPTLIICLARP